MLVSPIVANDVNLKLPQFKESPLSTQGNKFEPDSQWSTHPACAGSVQSRSSFNFRLRDSGGTRYTRYSSPASPTLSLFRSHSVGMHKVMGSSLIMHKESKTQAGLCNSKRIGGAGSHASAGGAGEKDTEEVNLCNTPGNLNVYYVRAVQL